MAEAPAEPSAGGQLEQKILQALRKASSTVRTPQLVKECQVPKQELNRVLYQMQKESKVSLVAPATWCLGGGDPHGLVPAEPAQPSIAQRPQQAPAAASESPGPRLSNLQERIYRFLEASGPCRALHIAKALGMRTAKDVNPDLYKMGSSHLLSCDEKSKEWKVSGADSGRRHLKVQPATIIYQQNPINMVYQSQISIANSEATQIGHGNVIVRGGENGAATPHPSPVARGNSWGPQNIHMEHSLLRRVQMGHGNEMELLSVPSEGPAYSLSGSPPVSPTVAAGSADASFEVRMPKPGPDPEGDMVQRIRIKSCHLEDAAIGNSNKMTVTPGTASRGRAAGPREDGGREPEPGQQQGDAGAPPEAAGSRGSFPPELGQAPPVLTPPTSELSTLTLEKPEAKAQTL
ncbi:PREDICTED: Z-DNA-binding protein 1 isoform X2 [Chinchilla lanigera]|uniref:Z-DNA-binding protein 1 isoform X2 n=1 Tax=Chinchilla lanigera TaxID=34839 RepID=UPI00038EDB21|nr:PREDICTED: Z-DNA-binding protein 1 isoform X2 [Chinchilla lanigera]